MALKITCPHCSAPHRLDEPFPLPGAEVQCGSCGQPMSISYPQGLIERMRARGVQFAESKKKIDQRNDSLAPQEYETKGIDTDFKSQKRVETISTKQSKPSVQKNDATSKAKDGSPNVISKSQKEKKPRLLKRMGPKMRLMFKVFLILGAIFLVLSIGGGIFAYSVYTDNVRKLDCKLQKDSYCQKYAAEQVCQEKALTDKTCDLLSKKTDSNTDHFEFLRNYDPATVTVIKDRHGMVMGEIYEKRRYVRPLVQDCGTSRASKFPNCPSIAIPEVVQNAFIAAEDANFWKHEGVDYEGIVRAIGRNLKKGKKAQGASTITQQVAKNFLLTNEKTYERKIKEIVLAKRLEKALDKNQILYLYLNEIYLGSGAYGVESAARTYFNKPVSELTLAEASIIAGLPQRPSFYSPHKSWEYARARQEYVLGQLLKKGFIEQAEYDAAMSERVAVYKTDNEFLKQAPYYTEHVRRYLVETYGHHMVYNDGLEVITACDLEKQKAAQKSLVDGVEIADRKTGWRGPKKTISEDQIANWRQAQENEMRQEVVSRLIYVAAKGSGLGGSPPLPESSRIEIGKWYEAVVLSVEKKSALVGIGNHTAYLPLLWNKWTEKPNLKRSWKRRSQDDMRKALSVGDVVDVRIEYLSWEDAKTNLTDKDVAWSSKDAKSRNKDAKALNRFHKSASGLPVAKLMQKPKLEGALFSFRLQNSGEDVNDQGAVLAMVGGVDYESSEFNRVTQAKRQVGSTFKPMVYAAAIESRQFTAGSIVADAPTVAQYNQWRPGNYDGSYLGNITLRKALAMSRNVCTIRVIEKVSLENVFNVAGPGQRIGYDKPLRTRKLIDDHDGRAACIGSKSPATIKGKAWCEHEEPSSCPLVNIDGAFLKGKSDPPDFTCLDEPFQKNGSQWCHSCDVNLRVCSWLDYREGRKCLDARMDKSGNLKCRECDASMALGSSSLTMVELARAYSVYGTYGDLIEPYYIEEVKYRDGTIIETHDKSEPLKKMDDGVAAISHWLLTNVANGGTAARSRTLSRKKSRMQLAGKTGTTNDFFDAWFVGYNPDILTTTWVGYDTPRSMGSGMAGGYVALPIWIDYMKGIFPWEEETRTKKFPSMPSKKVRWITINEATGERSSEGSRIPMLIGTEPQNVAVNEGQTNTDTIDDEDY